MDTPKLGEGPLKLKRDNSSALAATVPKGHTRKSMSTPNDGEFVMEFDSSGKSVWDNRVAENAAAARRAGLPGYNGGTTRSTPPPAAGQPEFQTRTHFNRDGAELFHDEMPVLEMGLNGVGETIGDGVRWGAGWVGTAARGLAGDGGDGVNLEGPDLSPWQVGLATWGRELEQKGHQSADHLAWMYGGNSRLDEQRGALMARTAQTRDKLIARINATGVAPDELARLREMAPGVLQAAEQAERDFYANSNPEPIYDDVEQRRGQALYDAGGANRDWANWWTASEGNKNLRNVGEQVAGYGTLALGAGYAAPAAAGAVGVGGTAATGGGFLAGTGTMFNLSRANSLYRHARSGGLEFQQRPDGSTEGWTDWLYRQGQAGVDGTVLAGDIAEPFGEAGDDVKQYSGEISNPWGRSATRLAGEALSNGPHLMSIPSGLKNLMPGASLPMGAVGAEFAVQNGVQAGLAAIPSWDWWSGGMQGGAYDQGTMDDTVREWGEAIRPGEDAHWGWKPVGHLAANLMSNPGSLYASTAVQGSNAIQRSMSRLKDEAPFAALAQNTPQEMHDRERGGVIAGRVRGIADSADAERILSAIPDETERARMTSAVALVRTDDLLYGGMEPSQRNYLMGLMREDGMFDPQEVAAKFGDPAMGEFASRHNREVRATLTGGHTPEDALRTEAGVNEAERGTGVPRNAPDFMSAAGGFLNGMDPQFRTALAMGIPIAMAMMLGPVGGVVGVVLSGLMGGGFGSVFGGGQSGGGSTEVPASIAAETGKYNAPTTPEKFDEDMQDPSKRRVALKTFAEKLTPEQRSQIGTSRPTLPMGVPVPDSMILSRLRGPAEEHFGYLPSDDTLMALIEDYWDAT